MAQIYLCKYFYFSIKFCVPFVLLLPLLFFYGPWPFLYILLHPVLYTKKIARKTDNELICKIKSETYEAAHTGHLWWSVCSPLNTWVSSVHHNSSVCYIWSTVKSPVLSLNNLLFWRKVNCEVWVLKEARGGSTLSPFQRFCHFLLPEILGRCAEWHSQV